MADVLTPAQRHYNMTRIRSKDTGIEKQVRCQLHADGFRYRLNVKDLPGKPDIVLPKYKTVVFINGCFWHGHQGCKNFVIPKTNTGFWITKIEGNIKRDKENYRRIELLGWNVIVVWECSLKKSRFQKTISILESFIKENGAALKGAAPNRKTI
ncbi:MAG: DNA mismatch endonuclease Vsr [Bacteroidales bacterium]|nr:DNA mismatch endonuclease Vsr [Bacteroidales bacterium]